MLTIYIITFVFGAIAGSFLNVCIYRMPKGLSIIKPSSHCTSCESPIRFYDNIPIMSYILLGGKCRKCSAKIPLKYPIVEFLNALLYVTAVWRFMPDISWHLLAYFVFLSSMIVITFIDLEHQIIPDRITLPGMPLGLIAGSVILHDPFWRYNLLGFKASVAGLLLGAGLFYLVAIAGRAIFRKEAMGGGDIKMMGMVGAFLGWKGVLLTTFLGSLFGSIIGILLIALKGRQWGSKIPFGPYLALGSVISLLWGQEFLIWYLYAR